VHDVLQSEPGTPLRMAEMTHEVTMPLYDDDDLLDVFHDKSPIRYCHIDNIIDNSEPVPG
jgi:hypothetical protein